MIIDSGMKTSGDLWTDFAPVKLGGLTPTIVTGVMLTVMTLPMTAGERSKFRA
jgi:hypothetical protein